MHAARIRTSGVTFAVALLATLTSVAHAGVRPGGGAGPFAGGARPVARLVVPFAAPDGYLFTVRPSAAAAMRAAGATELMADAGIWRVRGATGAALATRLRSTGDLLAVDRNERRQTRAADPLRAAQYAFSSIHLPPTAPAPKRRILIIDTGLDVTHPDIAARAAGTTVAANHQDVTGVDGNVEWHGTAVASTIGAAVDGQGGQGIYPAATIAMWDASVHPPGDCAPGGCIDGGAVVAGLDWAIGHHYDIVTMSLGSSQPVYAEFLAVERAIAHGILVVAAAGNEAQDPIGGNPLEYPAAYEHVLSVAASDAAGAWAPFSNFNATNDVSAPGVGVYAAIAKGFDFAGGGGTPVCDPVPGIAQPGWCQVDGTSFATPITAAAAAWVWSARRGLTAFQLADVLRDGARPGHGQVGAYDPHFGFGLLDVTRSLQTKPRAPDLLEPNGDVPMINGKAGFGKAQRAVLRAGQRRSKVSASADFAEDYEDVYRVEVPRGAKRLKVILRHRSSGRRTDDLNVCVWASTVRYVQVEDARSVRALLGCSKQKGATPDSLTIRLKRGTRRVYVDVYAPARSRFSDRYTLSLSRS
jgi:hypothetical protein